MYEQSLEWSSATHGNATGWSNSPTGVSEIDRSLLDEVLGQMCQLLESRELAMQLLQSSRLISLGQMAAGVAHELNQPLAAISATAEGILLRHERGDRLPPEQVDEMMGKVMTMIQRMTAIIEHMRTFSRDHSEEPASIFDVN